MGHIAESKFKAQMDPGTTVPYSFQFQMEKIVSQNMFDL